MYPVDRDRSFVEAWRARAAAARVAAAAWRRARTDEAAVAAEALSRLPGVRRVLLFGSLARGEAGPGSDVDLWIEGLPEAFWLEAVAAARAHVHDAEVDLVRAEIASAALADRVAADGIVLREV